MFGDNLKRPVIKGNGQFLSIKSIFVSKILLNGITALGAQHLGWRTP